MGDKNPMFAVEAGIAALRWLCAGYGYEITGIDVGDAYRHTMNAAKNAGCTPETLQCVRNLAASERGTHPFVIDVLRRELEGTPYSFSK